MDHVIAAATAERLRAIAAGHPYPLLFATISGAHLYGFPSPDSDYDLRGVHVLPPAEVVGLVEPTETITLAEDRDGLELDLVTHDAKKFFTLLLRRNGYVLEQLLSPLVVVSSPAHEELVALAPRLFTRHHVHHYQGFAANQWRMFASERPRRVKPLLYVFRVLLTGIALMREGRLCANLVALNAEAGLAWLDPLIARKRGGPEQGDLDDGDFGFYEAEYERLRAELEAAYAASRLPEAPDAQAALHDLLVRVRLGGVA